MLSLPVSNAVHRVGYPSVYSALIHLGRDFSDPLKNSFSPISLFSAGTQGVWYDPSDISTLFQDSAGTIPVTGAGQPVGRMLDKSGRGNHATQVTATSRPVLQYDGNGLAYLLCDGVDDWMVTGNIDFTGTNNMTFFAGLRKLSDVAAGTLLESSANWGSSTGTFAFFAPGGSVLNGVGFRSGGTIGQQADAQPFASPITLVVVQRSSIANQLLAGRVNGITVASNNSSQGTGNYGNYPLYLFRRGGTTLPFNGRFYGAVIVGKEASAIEIENTERYINNKTKAY